MEIGIREQGLGIRTTLLLEESGVFAQAVLL
jgi:hypothetical protein